MLKAGGEMAFIGQMKGLEILITSNNETLR
jgi:hypothetical protein